MGWGGVERSGITVENEPGAFEIQFLKKKVQLMGSSHLISSHLT